VNDQASSALVVDFYHRIAAGESKVSALQAAQQRLLADPRFRHPSYWAPFLLIGNWL
jgi:CHAT domain-containing protein